jgi:acyl-CoA reductase-like NAD-dependent aldehyde dehydrogenase
MPTVSTSRLGGSKYTHTIDGQSETSDKFFEVINPATGNPFALAPDASYQQLDQAVVAAQRAYTAWRRLSFEDRREQLENFADGIQKHADEIAEILTREQGKPLSKAKGEISGTIWEIETLCQFDSSVELIPADDRDRVELHYRPIGVVGAIAPWNFPILLSASKIAHALYAGNTAILKPSPYTPLSTLLIGELAQETLPPGVLNVLSGGNELGRWMTEHPGISRIAFTGSVATGKRVLASAAETLKRITLELGGNDPAILLEDVDIDTVASKIFNSAMINAGQTCIAIKRVYVHESLFEHLVEALVNLASQHRVGDGFDPDVQMGPIQNKQQYDRVLSLIEDSRQHKGAQVFDGGQKFNQKGYFVAPTIVTGLDDASRLVAEEQFGPVLPILTFRNVNDAIHRANNTRFGLGASVWSNDIERAAQVANQIEAGSVWINFHVDYDARIPFGGFKESGFGRELGKLGFLSYMEPQIIHYPGA